MTHAAGAPARAIPPSAWRAAAPGDDADIARLSAALYAEDPSPVPVPEAHLQRTLEALRAEPARGLAAVLEVGGAVRGYALLVSAWSNELGGNVCMIDELYVDEGTRGRGHGAALVEALAAHTGPWPREGRSRAVALYLEVTPTNARARQLYERLGFRATKNTTLVRRLPA